MTIESLGRKGGPKPGDLGAAPRHSRRPQPETRVVPTARPKPGPPRTAPGLGDARRAAPPLPSPTPARPPVPGPPAHQAPQGQQGQQGQQGPAGPNQAQAQDRTQRSQHQTQARVSDAKPARPPEVHNPQNRGPGQGPGQQKPRGRGDGKTDNRGERSLYDGGSPSANRLGPAKAMRARDVSRPRDW